MHCSRLTAHLKLEEVDGSKNLAAPGLRRACGGSLSCRHRCGSFGCAWPAELAVHMPRSLQEEACEGPRSLFRQCPRTAKHSHSILRVALCKRCTLLSATCRSESSLAARQTATLRTASSSPCTGLFQAAAHQLELVLLLIPLRLGIRQHRPCMVSSPLLGRQRGQCVQRRGRCRQPETGSHNASHSTTWEGAS